MVAQRLGVVVTILASEVGIAARTALHAPWVDFKNPNITKRMECGTVIHEWASFADIRGLDPRGRQPYGCSKGWASSTPVWLRLTVTYQPLGCFHKLVGLVHFSFGIILQQLFFKVMWLETVLGQ